MKTAFKFSKATVLVTGGSGFIGSNFIHHVLGRKSFSGRIINLDKLTYAGNPENLSGVEKFGSRYVFVKGDICDAACVKGIFAKYKIDCVVNFAAESHVDRSIHGPAEFINTNINGTFCLLEAAREFWKDNPATRFHHVSTDEVYGSLGPKGKFKETTPYDPRSPYSSSKASSDHLVSAYAHTYGLQTTISNCSNNYGPRQFPEKLLPLMILNAQDGKNLPVYGDGLNVRDWLYVDDHCDAIRLILEKGVPGQTYNVGGGCEKKNIALVRELCAALEKLAPSAKNAALGGRKYLDLIIHVPDRPGHDRRYAIDFSKIKRELGWQPSHNFKEGLLATVEWYLSNTGWIANIKSGSYRKWLEKNYSNR
jgi:dTDP-glucose 4,6-dehydratase